MLRLSAEVHDKIIRQAVPDVTDKEVDEIIYNYPTANPFYYPEWWNQRRFLTTDGERDIDLDYERLATRAINSSDPIRLVIIEKLAIFSNDDDEDLIDYRVNKCTEDHRRLVMRMNNPEDEDIGES